MINQVSTNLLQNYLANYKQVNAQPKVDNENTQPQVAQDIVKKETADAAKAYAGVVTPQPKAAPEKKSLDELKADLLAQGKVEGKDFIVRKDELASRLNVIENGKTVKVYRFDKDGASKDDFEAVQEFSYPVENLTLESNGLKQTETTYGADGEFHFRTFRYEKDKSPYKNDIVNYDTKPFELENKLKADGIQFARDIEFVNEYMINKITAFDPKTNEVTRYEFRYDKDNDTVNEVIKCLIDKDGSMKADITFRKDETDYTDYKNNLIA